MKKMAGIARGVYDGVAWYTGFDKVTYERLTPRVKSAEMCADELRAMGYKVSSRWVKKGV